MLVDWLNSVYFQDPDLTILSYELGKKLDIIGGLRSSSVLKLALMSLAKKPPYVHGW